MKKFYFLLVAMLVGFAANAGWFISGGFQGWSHCNANYELKETSAGSGIFTLNVESISGEFLICGGTVGTPDWSKKVGTNGAKVVADKVYNYKDGAGNFQMDGTVTNATITLDTNAKTLLIAGAAAANSFDVVYLVGDINGGGWNETITTYPLASKGNDTYEGNLTVTSVSYVKPRCGNEVLSASGSDLVPEMGKTYTLGAGDKAIKLAVGTYTVTVVADQKAESAQITFNGEGGDDPIVDIDFTSWYVNVIGVFNNWEDNGVNPNAEGESVHNGLAIGTSDFKIKIWNGTADVYYSTGSAIAQNEWVTIDGNADANMTIAGATEGQEFNVFFDCAKGAIKVVPVGGGDDPVVDVPEALYMIGDIKGAQWSTSEGVELTKNGNVFTVEDVVFEAVDPTADCYFSFTSALGADWDELNGAADRFGAEVNGTQIVLGTAAEMVVYKNNVNASACNAWVVVPGTYDVTVDFDNMTVTLAGMPSGVDSIAVDANNVAPVYYNLQGVQVNEPAAGLYIVRRGDKVAKEIVR